MPTACTASVAASTLPGPTGKPAARSALPKCMTFSSSRPPPGLSEGLAEAFMVFRRSARRSEFGAHLLEDPGRLAALNFRDVVLVLEQHAQRVVDCFRREREHVQLGKCMRPVDGLGNAGKLEEVGGAELLYESHDLARQYLSRGRCFDAEDVELALGVGIIDPI